MSLCGWGERIGRFEGFLGQFAEGMRRCHLGISNIGIFEFNRIEEVEYELKCQALNLEILKLLDSLGKL